MGSIPTQGNGLLFINIIIFSLAFNVSKIQWKEGNRVSRFPLLTLLYAVYSMKAKKWFNHRIDANSTRPLLIFEINKCVLNYKSSKLDIYYIITEIHFNLQNITTSCLEYVQHNFSTQNI